MTTGPRKRATPNAFGIQSSSDMLMKLQRDFDRLARSLKPWDTTDHGLNVAMTAWHLIDWVWAEIKHSPTRLADLGIQGEGGKAFEAFKDYVLNACPELRYCQIIATSAKHLGYKVTDRDPKFITGTAPESVTWLNNQGMPVGFANDKGQLVRWLSNVEGLFIFEGEKQQRAIDVFVSALIWWQQFLKEGDADSIVGK
jgi:hypothetical protein